MVKRKKTPVEIETNVLTMSARRCCICFGIQMDLSDKKGQIAHLDNNPSNSEFENLAYLCIPHHDDYDSKTRQSKGLTMNEVKAYRTLLYEAVSQLRNGSSLASIKQDNNSSEINFTSKDISDLLSKVQSRNTPLAQCLAEGVALAQKLRNNDFEKFCRNELSGYTENMSSIPIYRIIDIFVGFAKINMRSPVWGKDINNVFEHMKQNNKNFVPYQISVAESISSLETKIQSVDLQKGIMTFSLKVGDLNPNADNPNIELPAYAHPAKYQEVFEAIRRELTIHLLNLLPTLNDK